MNEEMMLPISKPEGVDTVPLDVLITLSAPRVQCSESTIKLITIIRILNPFEPCAKYIGV